MERMLFLAMMMAVGLLVMASEPADSLAADTEAVELKDVEVEAKMQSTSAKGSVFIPTKQQRDAASNATDLLFRMGIPELDVKPMGTSVSTISGESVQLFIDCLPATEADVEGLRTEDVRRVEVLNFPTDPRFQGALHVVNFIMQKYEYGGYTKLSVSQFVPFQYTDFNVYSKFAYKKMTFDVTTGLLDRRTHHLGTATQQTYMLTSPTGTEYAQERNLTEGNSHQILDKVPVSFRASYNGNKAQISNTVGFSYSNTPRQSVVGAVDYGNGESDGHSYDSRQSLSSRTVSWNGNYYFILPSSFTLAVDPRVRYENRHSDSYYVTTLYPSSPIVNDVRENMVDGALNFNLHRAIGDRHSVALRGMGAFINDRLEYSGTSPYKNVFHNYSALGALEYAYSYGKWFAKIDGGVIGEWNDINGSMVKDVYPFGHLNVSYSPDNRSSIRAYVQYATTTPGLAERSPNVQQSNEFLYITGDPDVLNSRHTTLFLSYNWMPSNRFQLSAFASYYRIFDRLTCIYDSYDNGRAVIRQYLTNGDYTSGQLGTSAFYAILPGKLYANCTLTQDFFRSTGYYDQNRNPFRFNATLSWYLGNFGVYGYYQSESRSLSQYGAYVKNRDSYQIGMSYFKGGLKVQLAVVNFMRFNHTQSVSYIETPVFSQISRSMMQYSKFNVALRVSYTFHYGKKVQEGNELEAVKSGKSGILQ